MSLDSVLPQLRYNYIVKIVPKPTNEKPMSNLKMAMLTLKYGNPKIQQSPPPEELNISVQSLPEAKLKIKTLKLKKKEYALVKR
ncbi:MAG: hypothetical protein HC939_22470 [Pleurocapsa sp. SU_5_0]|nr:hypothetical protein [Pleurocapsa sp. SU_5_0]